MKRSRWAMLTVAVIVTGAALLPTSTANAAVWADHYAYARNAPAWSWSWNGYQPVTQPQRMRPMQPKPAVRSAVENPKAEKVIAEGYRYLGTPYEFGSDRNNSRTFDCSDFIKHIFQQALTLSLPSDSRKQGAYVKELGRDRTKLSDVKRGDLLFFMSYRGPDAGDYRGVDKSRETITHVGMYLGNGKMLHTYSKDSGGVRVDDVYGKSWEYRFLFGGSVLNE